MKIYEIREMTVQYMVEQMEDNKEFTAELLLELGETEFHRGNLSTALQLLESGSPIEHMEHAFDGLMSLASAMRGVINDKKKKEVKRRIADLEAREAREKALDTLAKIGQDHEARAKAIDELARLDQEQGLL